MQLVNGQDPSPATTISLLPTDTAPPMKGCPPIFKPSIRISTSKGLQHLLADPGMKTAASRNCQKEMKVTNQPEQEPWSPPLRFDEPIGGVDPAARDYILNTIINNYSPNSTVLISTHLILRYWANLDEIIFPKTESRPPRKCWWYSLRVR